MRLAVVILAGGKGSRFWPRSRTDQPKQFLPLTAGGPTLLQATYERARVLAGDGAVYAVLPREYQTQALEQIPALRDRLLIEPCARDTAAAVAFVTAAVRRQHGADYVLALLPADHFVPDVVGFVQDVRLAAEAASEEGGIWTLGIPPARPESAYGYIVPETPGAKAARVRSFVEKPDFGRAHELIGLGALWNAGIFVARIDEMARAIRACALDVANAGHYAAEGDTEAYEALKPTSFDYAVLEQWSAVHVVRASFAWDDVGTWTSLERVVDPDASGNVITGSIVSDGVERSILVNDDPTRDLLALGVSDVVCVVTEHGALVASKDRVADIKRLYPSLRRQRPTAASIPVPSGARVVDKPWGREVWWAHCERYVAKILEVAPHQSLSLQYHMVKHETVLVVAGYGTGRLGDREVVFRPGVLLEITPGTVHRFEAGDEGVVLLEASTAEVEDVVRLEDRYGRAEVAAENEGATG